METIQKKGTWKGCTRENTELAKPMIVCVCVSIQACVYVFESVSPCFLGLKVTGRQFIDLGVHYLEVMKRGDAKNIAVT